MSDLGIIASFQLTWVISAWPEYLSEFLPENYTNLRGRWRDILEAGVPSIGSTDFPYNYGAVGSATKSISLAVTKIDERRQTPPDYILNQTISVEQALRLLTIDAAYGTFQEEIKGSIKVGKYADLVVLSDNPLTVPKSSLGNLEILMTMVGGAVEFCAPGQQTLCTGTVLSNTTGSSTSTTTSTSATTPALTAFVHLLCLV